MNRTDEVSAIDANGGRQLPPTFPAEVANLLSSFSGDASKPLR